MASDNGNPSSDEEMTVEQLDHIALTVSNVEASRKWYRDILGFESLQTDPDIFVPYISNGKVNMALLPVQDGREFIPSAHQGSRATHAAFKVGGSTYEAYKTKLNELDIEYEELNHQYAYSIYFRDPDGYVLELTTYDVA